MKERSLEKTIAHSVARNKTFVILYLIHPEENMNEEKGGKISIIINFWLLLFHHNFSYLDIKDERKLQQNLIVVDKALSNKHSI